MKFHPDFKEYKVAHRSDNLRKDGLLAPAFEIVDEISGDFIGVLTTRQLMEAELVWSRKVHTNPNEACVLLIKCTASRFRGWITNADLERARLECYNSFIIRTLRNQKYVREKATKRLAMLRRQIKDVQTVQVYAQQQIDLLNKASKRLYSKLA